MYYIKANLWLFPSLELENLISTEKEKYLQNILFYSIYNTQKQWQQKSFFQWLPWIYLPSSVKTRDLFVIRQASKHTKLSVTFL